MAPAAATKVKKSCTWHVGPLLWTKVAKMTKEMSATKVTRVMRVLRVTKVTRLIRVTTDQGGIRHHTLNRIPIHVHT